MKNKKLTIFGVCLAAVLAVGATVYAVTNYGSESDPLITKSYLDSVVQPALEESMRAELDKALGDARSGSGEFSLLTLRSGQRVICGIGTEVLPRIGSVTAYAYDSADVAVVDTTSATAVRTGAPLTANHLYMVTIRGNGFTADQNNTKVLISGEYTVE